MILKILPGELEPLVPVGVFGGMGNFRISRLFPESGGAAVAVAGGAGPVLAVHPEAVHAVFRNQLQKLGDHVFIRIAGQGAGQGLAGFPVLLHQRPFRVLLQCRRVPNAGIVHHQGDSHFLGGLPPFPQGVFDDAGGGNCGFAGIAGVPGVPFAVALDKIRPDFAELFQQLRPVRVFAQIPVGFIGVDIKVEAEKYIIMPLLCHNHPSFWIGGTPYALTPRPSCRFPCGGTEWGSAR